MNCYKEKENEEYLEKMNKELQDGIAKYGSIEAYSESITMPLKVEMTIQRIKYTYIFISFKWHLFCI